MYLVHIYAYPYKYTYIQVLMAQNSCISQPYCRLYSGSWLLIWKLAAHLEAGCSARPDSQSRLFSEILCRLLVIIVINPVSSLAVVS